MSRTALLISVSSILLLLSFQAPVGSKTTDPFNRLTDTQPAPFVANYDEIMVPAYRLPDPLTYPDGGKIVSLEQWETFRRPEILRHFENEVYGKVPDDYDDIRFITRKEASLFNGKAIHKEVEIRVFRNSDSICIHLLLIIPRDSHRANSSPGGACPAFLLINHRMQKNPDPATDPEIGYWPASLLVENGFAISIFHVSNVAPDDKDAYHTEVIQKLYPEQHSRPNGMMALGAWGWGAGRIMDYFENEPLVDHERVAVLGHSRSGKAALWCGARDQRFAIVISNNSGCGGAALSRRRYGETVGRINRRFPHWFCENFNRYNEHEDALPVDQHMLIALMAPRPVYIATAVEDRWADTKGQFLSGWHANPVYELYGLKGLTVNQLPEPDHPVQDGMIGFHLRSGKHDLTQYDWEQYIEFANIQYGK